MSYSAVNTIWVLVGAASVFFMQAGFSMCEAGIPEQNCRKYSDEKLDGLLYWNTGILACRIRVDVWKRFCDLWNI